ncbi:MAG: radical SAM protein [Microthrixaceae bacterium]
MSLRGRLTGVPVRLRDRSRVADVAAVVGHGEIGAGAAGAPTTACAAPATQLRFDPNGLVTSCCRTVQPLGHVARNRLVDLWNGDLRRATAEALEKDDYSHGCQRCGDEVAQEGREVAYARAYDGLLGPLVAEGPPRFPWRMEFNLSNACNLQCIQCDGESSSMIRLHRERRSPLPEVYDDRFFEDLRLFLPHLREAVFAGGEPFLSRETHRVWDLIATEAPHVRCSVVTNATQWSDRIAAWFERLRFDVVFSLDGITAQTYEAIRVGADFDEVMANVDRMLELVRAAGSTASVNHCLMPQNVHEFADLLAWADRKGLPVNVCVVRTPAHCSIARLPVDEIRSVDARLAEREVDGDLLNTLQLNREVWRVERARISSWAMEAGGVSSHTVMFFRCDGEGSHDDADVMEELADLVGSERLVRVSIGADDRVRWCDATELPGSELLAGRSYHELTKVLSARHGEMAHFEVLSTGADRLEAEALFGATPARIVYSAMRDVTGRADTVNVVIAFGIPLRTRDPDPSVPS